MISDSLNNSIEGVRNFKWKDALWLPQWGVSCFPTRDQELEIIKIAFKMQQIRDFFGMPINVTSWLRPKLYNTLIKGATDSAHLYGMAVDFTIEGVSLEQVKFELVKKLDDLKIRMEKGTTNWCHVDNREPGKSGRYFER